MRVVLDPNVIISSAISPAGPPAGVVRMWRGGAFDVVVSIHLLDELKRVLAYPKVRRHVPRNEAAALDYLFRTAGVLRDDPADPPPVRSPDPYDDYLIALASSVNAVIVSGDRQLLALSDDIPVFSPAAFLDRIKGR